MIQVNLNRVLKRNERFKRIWEGQEVCVIGNGPSQLNIDPNKLTNRKVICVNDYHKTELSRFLLPDALVFIDPDYSKQYNNLALPILNYLGSVDSHIIALTLANNLRFASVLENRRKTVEWMFVHFNDSVKSYSPDLSQPLKTIGQNVINLAIILSIFCGARTVYLLGIDHEILSVQECDFENDWDSNHAYPEKSKDSSLKRRLADGGLGWKDLELIIKVMIYQYGILRTMCELSGVAIFNATPQSHLKTFNFLSNEEVRKKFMS
jgi:hypothetical protein